jgi:hypothetical protein
MKRYILLFLFTATVFITGCESMTNFRTEASVRSQLEGSWSMVPIPRNSPPEIWTFTSGLIVRKVYDTSGGVTTEEHGTYSVKTTFTSMYVTIDNVPYGSYISAKWTIVALDSQYLTMTQNGGFSEGTGLLQKEFVKK